MFSENAVNLNILKQRAYNLRWATLPADVIPLTSADPDFPSAPEITEAIRRFMQDRYLCYGPPDGLPEFRKSVALYFQKERLIDTSPDLIFPVDSAAFGIYLVCKAFLLAGEEAIIFDPVDFLFRYSVTSAGGIAIPFPIPAGLSLIDFEELEKLITKKTRLLCLCNPLNPTGKVFTKEELLHFGEIACKHNLIILSDEIWSAIVYPPAVFTSIASLNERIKNQTITITGFSKSHGLAGLRIGAVMASNNIHYKKLLDASLHNTTIHGVSVLSQIAAAAALNECDYWLKDFLTHLQAMRDLCVKELNAIPGFKCIAPNGCYVAFVNILETGKTCSEVQEFLLNTGKVAVVPGLKEWFGEGAKEYIRISFATSEKILQEALTRIKNTMPLIK
jgi:aminotransferase